MDMKKQYIFLLLFAFGCLTLLQPAPTFALTEADCDALTGNAADFDLDLKTGTCVPKSTGLSEKPIEDVTTNLMQWFLYIFGMLAIIAFTVSGIMYLTAAGDENQIDKAKRQMIYSVVGVIVALSALIILNAISDWLAGSSTF